MSLGFFILGSFEFVPYSSLCFLDLRGEPGGFTNGACNVGNGTSFFKCLRKSDVYVIDFLVSFICAFYVCVLKVGIILRIS